MIGYSINLFGYEAPILLLLLPVMTILSTLVGYTSSQGKPAPEIVFLIVSSVLSVFWIHVGARMVFDLLTFISHITNSSKTFISLTLLALGNSVGDLFVNTSIAKRGFGVMAITGIFSGQLLNLLIGFSLSSIVSMFRKGMHQEFGGERFLEGKSGFLIIFLIAYCCFRQIILILQGVYQTSELRKGTSLFSIMYYLMFFVLLALIELYYKD